MIIKRIKSRIIIKIMNLIYKKRLVKLIFSGYYKFNLHLLDD